MRFGATRQQRDKAERARAIARQTPHRWFAWYPVRTYDTGITVWWEDVIRFEAPPGPNYWHYYWRYKEINDE